MKTIKIPVQNLIDIKDIQRIYSSAVRYAYNRVLEECTEKDIRSLMKNKFKIGSWLVQCSIKQALSIHDSQKQQKRNKIVFGSKTNFIKRQQNKITKQEYQEKRLISIQCQGERLQKGNRLFDLDIVQNNSVTFKPNKDTKIKIQLPKLRKNIKQELQVLELLTKNKEIAVQINLSRDFIYFVFDEAIIYNKIRELKQQSLKKCNENNVLGIDLNPNYIGISVIKFKKDSTFDTIFKQVIDLTTLNKKSTNKKEYEFYEITKHISNLALQYNVQKIAIEELKIQPSDLQKGKKLNKLCNNDWNRNIVQESLTKYCNIYKIQLVKVNAAYSSTVGNLAYGNNKTPDMIASSIEIARRAFKKYEKLWFYPSLNVLLKTGNQWKEELFLKFKTWIQIHEEIKNSKLSYRVQLKDCIPDAVFRFSNIKSYVTLYNFI